MFTFEGYKVAPDRDELVNVLWNKKKPSRVHHIELFHDLEVVIRIATRYGIDEMFDKNDSLYLIKLFIEVFKFLGIDVFHMPNDKRDIFKLNWNLATDTASKDSNKGDRTWMEEGKGPIQSWKDFENYPWPDIKEIDFSRLEWMEKNLPSNMGCYYLTGSILERLAWLLGYETLCYFMYDAPDLIDAICDKIGTFYVEYTKILTSFNCVPLLWGSDDMGFRTSTLVPPDFLRLKILPWHKRCAETAHEAGKPYLLHCCGKIDEIMDDLIYNVGIDAKHSFEDAILEVTDAYKIYAENISILGGIDVDFLCRSGENEIRSRVNKTLEICMPKGGYCLGTGNTMANYIPLDNYLIMIDEGNRFKS
jgi:uroporphyrinogen decarboxylase